MKFLLTLLLLIPSLSWGENLYINCKFFKQINWSDMTNEFPEGYTQEELFKLNFEEETISNIYGVQGYLYSSTDEQYVFYANGIKISINRYNLQMTREYLDDSAQNLITTSFYKCSLIKRKI